MNNPVGLDSLFKEKLFRIPDYQRGYAWQENQLKDFWEDLTNLQDGRSHYTGVITLSEIPTNKIKDDSNEYWLVEDHSYKVYNIVDGQQRLTTCIILLQSILDFMRDIYIKENKIDLSLNKVNKTDFDKDIYLTSSLSIKSISEKYIFKKIPTGNKFLTYKFGYNVDNPSYSYLKHRIFNEKGAGEVDETFYTLNLKNAKTYFTIQIQQLFLEENTKGIQSIYKKLTKSFLFNEYIIKNEFDVYVAFETMNNRGKSLSKLELLKNRLIYLTTLYPDNELDPASRKDLRDTINDSWREVYYQLGRNKTRPLNDDDFLKAHWIMTFKYSRKKGNDYIKFLLDEYFTPKNIHKKIEKHITLENPVEQTADFDIDTDIDEQNGENDQIVITSKLEPTQIKDYVISLKESAVHWFNTFYPSMANELNNQEKEWTAKLNRIGMGYFRPLLMSIFKNISLPNEKYHLIKHIERYIFICFHLGHARRNFGDSEFFNAAREIDSGSISIEQLHNKLLYKENLHFHDNGIFNTKIFSDYIYKKFTVGDKAGFYHWSGIRYFLFEYEQSLLENTFKGKPITWDYFIKHEKDKISIEHIYPQTDKGQWKINFERFNQNQKYILKGSLGNLLLLSQSINASLQNDNYADKIKTKLNSNGDIIRNGYANGSKSEIQVSQLYENWTFEEIKNRSLKLLDFLEKRWDINLGDTDLKLDFIQYSLIESLADNESE